MPITLIKQHPYPAAALAGTLGLGLFLFLTNPNQVSIGLLVVPVVLLFLISFCVSQVVLINLRFLHRKPRKRRIVALSGASLITVIAILHSTGGISIADVVLLVLIVLIAAVYIERF